MIRLILVSIFIVSGCINLFSQLYPIFDNGMYGYINAKGEVKVDFQYKEAQLFSEGYAGVRTYGRYGFINEFGEMVIDSKYDYVTPFIGKYSVVYQDGISFVIDEKDSIVLNVAGAEVSIIPKSELFLIISRSGKRGIVNISGKVIIDTLTNDLNVYPEDNLAVLKIRDTVYSNNNLIDYQLEYSSVLYELSTGREIVGKGIYDNISEFSNDYGVARKINDYSQVVIDMEGMEVISEPEWEWGIGSVNQSFINDLVILSYNYKDPDSVKTWSSSKRYDYKGVKNLKGVTIFKDKKWDELSSFTKDGYSFAKDTNDQWFLIDLEGVIIFNDEHFDGIVNTIQKVEGSNSIENYYIYKNKKIGRIEKIDNRLEISYMEIPIEYGSSLEYCEISNDKVVFHDEVYIDSISDYRYLYGFWDVKSGFVSELKYESVNVVNDSLLYVKDDDNYGYISNFGNWIWKQSNERHSNKSIDITYMNRGYFYVKELSWDELLEKNIDVRKRGASVLDTKNEKIDSFGCSNICLIIENEKSTNSSHEYLEYNVYLVNKSQDTIEFSAQDNRLYLIAEALSEGGLWQPIEFLPSSWCGNSYYNLRLPNDKYWEFSMPIYSGEKEVKVRLKLSNIETNNYSTIYSNEVQMSINPGQLWRKNKYNTSGLMDPYNE